jgi:hypothetical protein
MLKAAEVRILSNSGGRNGIGILGGKRGTQEKLVWNFVRDEWLRMSRIFGWGKFRA